MLFIFIPLVSGPGRHRLICMRGVLWLVNPTPPTSSIPRTSLRCFSQGWIFMRQVVFWLTYPFGSPLELLQLWTFPQLRECQCLMLNFHLDSSVSRRRSLQGFKLGTRPWECLFEAFHSFWINAFSFLTQSVFSILPSQLLAALLCGSFPTKVGDCAILT